MENFCDMINHGILDIFSVFSLGTRNLSKSMQFFMLIINTTVPLVILGFYLSKGSFFVSSDPLSKATDIFEMFVPFSIHIFIMFSHTMNWKIFHKINLLMNALDENFKNLNPINFEHVKISATLWYLLKFSIVHLVSCGIEIFLLIS